MTDRLSLPIRGLSITDGDSIAVEFGIRQIFRLYGIDTPEKRNPDEAEAAAIAQRAVDRWYAEHRPVTILWREYDKFGGRNLGEVVGTDGTSLNQWLLARKLAKPYYGERKPPWAKHELDLILAQANDFPAEPVEEGQ